MLRHSLLCLFLFVQVGCKSKSGPEKKAPASDTKPDVLLESVQIGKHSIQFYIDHGADSAVLGFFIPNATGKQHFFPMYASTYRGIPSVQLEVFVSNSQEEMWVHSSWPGYEVLAYHRLGTDQCITRYGEIASFDKPIPDNLSGGNQHFPQMNKDNVTQQATIKYVKKSPNP